MTITIENTPSQEIRDYDVIVSFPEVEDVYATITAISYGYGIEELLNIEIRNPNIIPSHISIDTVIDKIKEEYENRKLSK